VPRKIFDPMGGGENLVASFKIIPLAIYAIRIMESRRMQSVEPVACMREMCTGLGYEREIVHLEDFRVGE